VTDTNANLVLLPWLRRGGTSALTQADSLGADQPGVATATASLAINDAPPITMPVRLMGPGHVTGLQTTQVIRMDPTPGSRAFEPNFFSLVEFDEPSLPWLFTPAAANAEQRLRPWLCLAVVRRQPGVLLSPPRRGSLPVLTISAPADPNAELPDPDDSWAWAHSQVTGELPALGPGGETDQSVAELTRLLDDRPDRTVSRLVCGRVLAPSTEYLACVVPTFELGRLAGLGLDIPDGEEGKLHPAWTLGDDLEFVELPVYHSWEFATGANGDFKSLAMLLRARRLPAGVGARPIDVSASGVDADVPARTRLPLGGALRPIPTTTIEPDGDASTPSTPEPASTWSATVHDRFRAALAGIINTPDAMPADEPLLTPPRYGAKQSGRGALDPAQRDRWYEQLNLEPEARVAAQYGTRLVREQQEALVASAWEQAAELRDVNTVLRNASFGVTVASSLHRRHLSRMSPEALLLALAPARAKLSLSAAARVPATGFVALLNAAQVPAAAFGTAMRRIARPQGAIFRRAARSASRGGSPTSPAITLSPVRFRTVLSSLQPGAVVARIDTGIGILGPPRDGIVSIERVALALQRQDITWLEASAAAVTNAPRRPGFAFTPFTPPAPGQVVNPPVVTPEVVVDPLQPGVVDPDPLPRPRPRPRPIPGDGRPRPVEPFAALRPRRDDDEDPFPFPEPDPEEEPDPRPHPIPRDSPAAALFRTLAAAHLQRFDPRPPVPEQQPFAVIDLSSLKDEALARAHPLETFTARIALLVDRRDGAPAPTEPTPAVLDAVDFTPRFPQPLAPTLAATDQDLMLPGLDLVPPNTVVPLETNSPFVESVLVGFNDELGRELVWREFPTPLQATYADRFWDPGVMQRPPDIPPLVEWGDRALGERNSLAGGAGSGERFVVLLRSELLRRYPHAVVYAVKPDDANAAPAMPILTGSMEPDVRFFGFDIASAEISDWSIVIAEQPTAPRFGIEVADVPELPAGANHLPLAEGDGDAAQLATRLRQQPVRVTIPASVLLTPN
jgi:hypothetical protein